MNFQKTFDPPILARVHQDFQEIGALGVLLWGAIVSYTNQNHLKRAQCQDNPQILVSSRDLVHILHLILYFTDLHFI